MSTQTRSLSVCLAALLLCAAPAQAADDIRLATTTSTENSGLLAQILPKFEAKYGAKVRVVAVGTGAALKLGEDCNADVLLVHARPLEDKFMAAGYGSVRKDVMYNDFVIVGPKSDPAGVRGGKDVTAAMKKIAASGAKFVSRGDESGTHQMEKTYWKDAGTQPQGAVVRLRGPGHGAGAHHGGGTAGLHAYGPSHLRRLPRQDRVSRSSSKAIRECSTPMASSR